MSRRAAVIAVEVLVAAGCFLAGWRLVSNHPPGPIQVQRGAPSVTAPDPFIPIPRAPAPGPATGGGRMGVTPGSDLLTRLNKDDLALYRTQWQVIQLLVDGTRQYIQKRVLLALLPG
ncbi:MAG: hypothetical protein M3O87_05400 [Candidatus Dormibacteraeota bacterium]|nr:hypothetical protein [Candidatus Dormibacteraeota bacterium]